MSSLIETSWRRQSSTRPSWTASSNTAVAYRLAAAVATRHLLDRLVDQLLVLRGVEGLADHLLGCGDDEAGNFAAHCLHCFQSLGLDLLASRFEQTSRLVLGLPLQLLAELLRRLTGGVNDALGRLSRFVQLRLGFFESCLSSGALPLGLLQLLDDLALACLRQPHDRGVNVTGENGQHH